MNDWASGHGNNTPAWSKKDKEYVQISAKKEEKTAPIAENKLAVAKEQKKEEKTLVQTKSEVNT